MERKGVILMAIFGTIGGLAVLVGLGLAAWLYLRVRRAKQQDEDLEYQDAQGDSFVEEPQAKSGKKNGFLNLKTPLISTKVFG